MAFTLIAFEELKNRVVNSIKGTISRHNATYRSEVDDIKDNLKCIPNDDKRQTQTRVLLECIEIITKMPSRTDAEKKVQARLLNSMVYFVYDAIGDSYKKSYLGAERSSLYVMLRTSLDLNADNGPDDVELLELYKELHLFFLKNVYKESAPRKGYLEVQAFDSKYAVEVIKSLREKIKFIEDKEIDSAEKLFEKSAKPGESKGVGVIKGFKSFFGSASSSRKSDHAAAASASFT